MKIFKNTLLVLLFTFTTHTYANNVKSVIPKYDIPEVDKDGNVVDAKSEAYDLKLQPQLTVDDNTLKPAITLFTRSNSLFTRTYKGQDTPFFDNYFLFQFTANLGIEVSDFENPT